ncbi:MAG: 3-phosphoshikimate 1-carboxyvinyltransferase, partial [Acidobacteria bacterium]|nr:3-phosphoshikimate 1-carboxyvinyltransferase [Acidobacteriota bacterium]
MTAGIESPGLVEVQPARRINGRLTLPGDKSISHRYAMLGALAEGESRFENFSTGADCASTLACLRALGASVRHDDNAVTVSGCAGKLHPPAAPLDCGNSGSTMRMLAGILAAQPFASELAGDESLSRRPMGRILEPLRRMGADIRAAEGDQPPLHITKPAAGLQGITYRLPIPSAQVKS